MRLSLSWPEVNAIVSKNLAGFKAQRVLMVFGILWLGAVGAGLWVLWDYENRPGIAADPPAQWPSTSRIEPAIDRPTLVMLVHPHCSCTRASIGELAVLMTQARLRPKTYVLFMNSS